MPGKFFRVIKDFVKILLIILIFSTIFTFWHITQQHDYDQQYITYATELRVRMQEVQKYSREILTNQAGQTENVKDLQNTKEKTTEALTILIEGKQEVDKLKLPPSPQKIQKQEIASFLETWNLLKQKISIVFQNREILNEFTMISQRLLKNVLKIEDSYWEIIKNLGKDSAQIKNIMMLVYQIDTIESLINDIQKISNTPPFTTAIEQLLSQKINEFLKNVQLITVNNPELTLDPIFNALSENLKAINQDTDALKKIQPAVEKTHIEIFDIIKLSSLISDLAKNLENAYIMYPKTNTLPEFAAYILGLLSFGALILSIYLFQKENESHIAMVQEKNQLMQSEVEKLLKELPDIANGEISIEAIAALDSNPSSLITDSFTYALNTLRHLVYNIGKTAQNVSLAASDAQKITKELATSSSEQAQEIVEITASVNAMATSIEQVSTNASESAAVALESVKIAGEGGQVVRNTISGMERIQTQIQETSNYMRRLSDSSQEIGEIVSLIDGIADQTNILSLNASIQAAMAGEAGRGFAVVADEVQRLAEKVSAATKDIESLVHSIQTDTNQVLVAMEQTKSQVSEGAHSAQAAGLTLEKIETVSRRLSDLIQNISSSASTQASVSGRISHIMNDVKGIAQQTASGTMTTVELIGKLMQFVTDLRNSVSDLKLPNDAKTSSSV